MQAELTTLLTEAWKDHFNTSNYAGDWSTLQLRSIGGQPDNNFATPSLSMFYGDTYQDTPIMQSCPAMADAVNFFQMEKLSVRLMKLGAGAEIKSHVDHELSFEEGEVRFHIPIITNADVEFFLDRQQMLMEEGSCWYLNLTLPHSVFNRGATERIHLVIDGKVNEWVRNWFAQNDHKELVVVDVPQRKVNVQEREAIITQLRLLNTDVSNKMADDMERNLPGES